LVPIGEVLNEIYIRPIEIEPEPEPEPQAADTAEELRSEVSYVQNLLGESRQRVTQLEELVASLRTINAAQEKAVVDAGKENTALRRQLAVVKEELTTAAAVSQQLQIELDAAQQVPADSPELLQLRLRLADMTLDRDQYKDAWNQIFTDQTTIRETTAAETVEAIIEWLQHFRGCNSPSLALLLLEALPHIIRNIVGLNTEDVE
jgi:septal ring factor EnvC (AmiA/AmiB activator)